MKICVICECGWIIIGDKDASKINTTTIYLCNASVVRRWSNGKGIGGIAKKENRDEYTLDPIGDVEIYQSKILFIIPCE